jgi:putative DNA primase/helicase
MDTPTGSNGQQEPPSNDPPPKEITAEDLCKFTEDDAGNGDAMYALYGKDFLFCPSRGWFRYIDTHWELDEDGASVKRYAVKTLRKRRHAAVELGAEAVVKCTKGDANKVSGCIDRFRTLVNVSIDEFDRHPDIINCKNGVVNLRNGSIEPHSRSQRFTYCMPVAYRPETVCLEWLDYLDGVVGGGREVIDYLQMALGYSMTGHTREEVLFYLYGPTRSGKGTISEIFMSLMPSPLSTEVDFNSFTAKREGDVNNFDLAPLKPSRLIFASESLKSQSLNPAKIKQLTGGDRIRACFKHKNFFEYRPQFKVWMLSNWPVNGDPEDDALWGRVRVIEFPNSFLGKEDKSKKERLRDPEALEGILAWVIEGAIAWYALGSSGLTTPDVIATTTKKQREELDYVQQWLDECCEENEGYWTSNEDVSKSYAAWCKGNNVQFPKGPKALAQSLQAKGFITGVQKKVEGKNKKGVNGLYIYPESHEEFGGNG